MPADKSTKLDLAVPVHHLTSGPPGGTPGGFLRSWKRRGHLGGRTTGHLAKGHVVPIASLKQRVEDASIQTRLD